jgi:CDP-glucose 4,6-dehydratase
LGGSLLGIGSDGEHLDSKSIAITGATGLLGAHLANSYVQSGHQVFALIKDEHSKSILSPDVTRVFGDISRKSDMEYFIQKSNPNYFVHLAAQTQAYDSLRYPYQTFYNNIVGTLNVLECLREFSNSESIVVASSDKAYGELQTDFYTEDHPLNGIYPYDASKSATDLVANSYRVTYGMPVVVTRACNIYGAGDYNRQRLIPGIVNAYMKNDEFTIRNSGKDLREYIHVEDVVTAYRNIIPIANSSSVGSSFNIASGDRYTTLEVFNLIEKIIGNPIKNRILNDESMEIKRQFMDSTKLTRETGWRPSIKFESILPSTVEWYLSNY